LGSPKGDFEILLEKSDEKISGYYDGDNKWILHSIVEKNDKAIVCNDKAEFLRGYPFDLLFDDIDEWVMMEQDKSSNFVLSDEEMQIASNRPEYPLFIGGRAGSGKSTVLQYLFAEIILRKYSSEVDGGRMLPPVYLSYNDDLVDTAKGLSKSLLMNNHAYKGKLENMSKQYEKDVDPEMNEMFRVFQNVVVQCIEKCEPNIVRTRFHKTKHVSFAMFNKLWNEKFKNVAEAADNYGPSLSWHVIRTYIKGWDSDSLLTPDDYKNIGDNNQSVTEETFRIVFEKVWESWYSRLTKDEYWDDQDLVRYCLSPDNSDESYVSEMFSAVFCDEAQDFTRVEMDFILKVSAFSNRKISSVEEVRKLPFVFAGDEFQTLNPTGFSWTVLRSYFVERLFGMVGLASAKNKSAIQDPTLLKENYRSTPKIVKIGNRIQLLRASRLGEGSTPQHPHFWKSGGSVFCLPPDDEKVWKLLKEKKVCLIIPSVDGQKAEDFLKDTPVGRFFEFDDDGTPKDITILNPIQAKGLEYQNVALYGFGNVGNKKEFNIDNLLKWFEDGDYVIESRDKLIELKYMLSNVYVAATRAKNKLYVLEKFDDDTLWTFAYSHHKTQISEKVHKLEKLMLDKVKKDTSWDASLLGLIVEGTVNDITDENVMDFDSDIAKAEESAEGRGDSDLLLQVAARLREHEDHIGEYRCLAKAASLNEDFMKAAKYFYEAKMYDNAVEAWWSLLNKQKDKKDKENCIKELASLNGKTSRKDIDRIVSICSETLKKISLSTLRSKLCDIVDGLASDDEISYKTESWQSVVNLLFENLNLEGCKESDLNVVIEKRKMLVDKKITFHSGKLAEIAFELEKYELAVNFWGEVGMSSYPKHYYEALVKIRPYPEVIRFYEKTGASDWENRIVEEFDRNGRTIKDMSSELKKILYLAICNKANDELFKDVLVSMLAHADEQEKYRWVVDAAKKRNIRYNEAALSALSAVRYRTTELWERPTERFADVRAEDLFSVVEKIKYASSPAFNNDLIDQSKKGKESQNWRGFMNEKFSFSGRLDFYPLFASEVGRCIELQSLDVPKCVYYEWVKGYYSSQEFRKQMDIRWIACKENQAKKQSDEEKSKKNRIEAIKKRNELSIGVYEYISETPCEIETKDWENYLTLVLGLGTEIVKPEDLEVGGQLPIQKPTPSIDEPVVVNSVPVKSNKKQVVKYKDYLITYSPRNKVVVIRYESDEEELNANFRDGKLVGDTGFYLENSRLCKAEDNDKTPFEITVIDNQVVIRIFESEDYSGLTMKFDLY